VPEKTIRRYVLRQTMVERFPDAVNKGRVFTIHAIVTSSYFGLSVMEREAAILINLIPPFPQQYENKPF
jgi:hypothetical protein